jgi:hypothetical protein
VKLTFRQKAPLVHCAEAITALLLSLRETRHTFGEQSPVSMLMAVPVGKLSLSILAGLALGLCSADRKVQHLLGDFQKHMEKYGTSLQELNPESLIALQQFARDVWGILKIAPAEQ